MTRYNAAGYPFPASFIAGDGFAIDLTEHLPPASFDVISCQARSIHWSPYGRVRVVDADPYGLLPSSLSAHNSLSIPALGVFQLRF